MVDIDQHTGRGRAIEQTRTGRLCIQYDTGVIGSGERASGLDPIGSGQKTVNLRDRIKIMGGDDLSGFFECTLESQLGPQGIAVGADMDGKEDGRAPL